MVDVVQGLQVATAVVTATFAVLVLSGGPRRAPNVFLAGFLLLICGNQVAEILRSEHFAAGAYLGSRFWFKIATVFASLDPLFLYYFASIYPERNRLHTPGKLGLVGAGAVLLVALAVLQPSQLGGGFVVWKLRGLAWAVFVAVVYGAVLVHLGRSLGRGEPGIERLLFPAVAIATIPAWARIARAAGRIGIEGLGGSGTPTMQIGLAIILLPPVAGWWWTRRSNHGPGDLGRSRERRVILGSLLAGSALALLVFPVWIIDLGTAANLWGSRHPGPQILSATQSAGTAVRWLAFSLLTSVAVLRFDMLGMSLKARRRSARALVVLGVLGATGLVLAIVQQVLGADGSSISVFDLVLLGVVVLASQGFRSITDRVAEQVYGVPMPGDRAAAAETYRAALEQARAEGRPLDGDPGLARLREELGLGERTAELMQAALQPPASQRLERGARVAGRYKVSRLIGEGGSGRAWLAYDEVLDRDVVLKEVPAVDEEDRQQAMEEARVAGSLNHPNVVTVHDVLGHEHAIVLVTEHVAGGSLEDRVREEGPLDPGEGARVVADLLAGLQAVHGAGIVHRDLKPSNVLLATDGTAKLADFGVARVRRGVTRTQEAAQVIAGTPEFMAPEQRRGEVATEKSDLYAVGRIMEGCLQAPLPDGLEAVRERALAGAPGERWGSAGEMLEAITHAGSS